MDRRHRLEFEDVLRALARPDLEIGVVLERLPTGFSNSLAMSELVGDGIVVDARAGRLVRISSCWAWAGVQTKSNAPAKASRVFVAFIISASLFRSGQAAGWDRTQSPPAGNSR